MKFSPAVPASFITPVSFISAANGWGILGGRAKWSEAVANAAPPQDGCGLCSRFYIEANSQAYCIAPDDSVCERRQARTNSTAFCSRFSIVAFDCGGTACSHDFIDQSASLDCPQCQDADGDGHRDINCGGDDCDDADDDVFPGAGEHCNDGKDNDCDGQSDQFDILCQECSSTYQWECWGAGGTFNMANCVCTYASPVVVDTRGDGFSLTNAAGGVNFDLDSNGAKEKLSWTAQGSGDAWLVLDRNGNGMVDNGQELFGNFTPQPASPEPHGFLALAEYDRSFRGGNGDGVIDRRDVVYYSLRLWRDANHNGISELPELHTLEGLDVSGLRLDFKESKRADEHGNRFRYRAKVEDARGARVGRWAWDVFLIVAR